GGLGISIIGGYVYRGTAILEFEGRYIFADWNRAGGDGNGLILIATPPEENITEKMWEFTELVPVPYQAIGAYILAIGQDADHELYILTTQNSGPSGETGRVYRLIPPPEDPEPSPAPGFCLFAALFGIIVAYTMRKW
ncbi:MAG: hypothetical protein D5R99_03810, partial [Methanocalculus sp. MSAO_Arc1]